MKFYFRAFFFFLCILSTALCYSQKDTLSTKNYDELTDLIKYYYGKNDTTALTISDSFIKKAIIDKDEKKQRLGYLRKAKIYQKLNDKESFTTAIKNALEKTSSASEINAQEEIYSVASKGYFALTDWAQSLYYFDKLKDIATSRGDKLTESSILSLTAFINTRVGDVQKGLQLNKEALRKTKEVNAETDSLKILKNQVLVSNHYTLTSAFLTLEEPDSALYHINEALLKKSISDSCTVKYLYFLQADGLIKKNKLSEAETSLNNAENICLTNNKDALLQANAYTAEIALQRRQYRESVDFYLKAFRIYDVNENAEGLMGELYKNIAKAYKGLGKLDSANFYLEKYINTSNELDRMKTDVYSVSKKQEAIIFQKELLELSKQKSQRDNLLLYGSFAGVAVIIILIIRLLRSQKKSKSNEQKFKLLLDKIENAQTPTDIINTKDVGLDHQSTSGLNPETTQQILDGLLKLESENYFLHPACSAHNVAKRIKTNTTYLSKVVNTEFGKNFSTYVNDLRINYAIVRLQKDSKFRSYTVSSIAKELGYKSADSFTKYFKRDTGLLPSFYIKKLNEVK